MESLPEDIFHLFIPFLNDPLDILSLSCIDKNTAQALRTSYTFRSHLRQIGFKNADIVIQRGLSLFTYTDPEPLKEWMILARYSVWRRSLRSLMARMKYLEPQQGDNTQILVSTHVNSIFCEDSDDEIFHEAQIFNELALIKKQDTPVQQVISLMMAHDLYCALSTRRLSTSLPECQPYYVPRAPSYLYTYCKRVALSIQNVAYIRLNALAHTTELAVRLFRQLSLTAAPNQNFLLPSGTLKAENFDRGSAEHIIDHSAAWFRSSQNKWFRNSDRLSVVGYYGYLNPSRTDVGVKDGPTKFTMTTSREDSHITLTGTGTDDHGAFTINGSQIGDSVAWTKHYARGWSIAYYGLLMPWGIVGEWGRPEPWLGSSFSPLGSFYLWVDE